MIHTVVFKLDHIDLPIDRNLFPDSAHTLNIFCNPKKYGWTNSNADNDICYMNMQGTNICPQTILGFIRILRNKQVINDLDNKLIEKMEHFAILIGAGKDECVFRIAIDNYNAKCKKKEEHTKLLEELIRANPQTPEKDIDKLYYWDCDSYHCPRDYLRTSEWDVTVPLHGVGNIINNGSCVYYRKLRKIEVQ